ncbi:hypothetical protein ABVK25_002059 [Lepraria finkii]|uniref:Uncharacterized protein n=1 Tax=Lepraria finkii TaxID=1340010 RepID=A0ABR4BJ27_9LECA
MPPAAKRRKVGSVTTKKLNVPATQKGIQAFGKISKSQKQIFGKSNLGKASISENLIGKDNLSIGVRNKRKLESIERNSNKPSIETTTSIGEPPLSPRTSRNATKDSASHVSSQSSPSSTAQPIIPRKRVRFAENTTETPTKGVRSRLESLTLPPSPPSDSSSPSSLAQYDAPPSSPTSVRSSDPACDESIELPDELQDLVNLHSSFLTALSLHYAHNGSMTPADLRNLGPGVERAWRKRRVTTDDIRRILALEGSNGPEKASPLYLSDYGSKKICVEISDSHHVQKAQRRPVNEEALNAHFNRNLEQQWTTYKAAHPQNPSPTAFISSLPFHPITPCASISKLAPPPLKRPTQTRRPQSRRHQSPTDTLDHNFRKCNLLPSRESEANHRSIHRPIFPHQSQTTPPIHATSASIHRSSGAKISAPKATRNCTSLGNSSCFFQETRQRRCSSGSLNIESGACVVHDANTGAAFADVVAESNWQGGGCEVREAFGGVGAGMDWF